MFRSGVTAQTYNPNTMEVEAREPTVRKTNLEYMVFQARLGYLVRPWNNKEAKPKDVFGGKQM